MRDETFLLLNTDSEKNVSTFWAESPVYLKPTIFFGSARMCRLPYIRQWECTWRVARRWTHLQEDFLFIVSHWDAHMRSSRRLGWSVRHPVRSLHTRDILWLCLSPFCAPNTFLACCSWSQSFYLVKSSSWNSLVAAVFTETAILFRAGATLLTRRIWRVKLCIESVCIRICWVSVGSTFMYTKKLDSADSSGVALRPKSLKL